jgi:FKBP-type peptidyl-prolyl cis-trans isomerase SlyD
VHGYAHLIPGLEAGLEGARRGERRTLELAPEEAFGERVAGAVLEVDRHDFPAGAGLAVGDDVEAEGPGGARATHRVLAITGDAIVLDLNHPLAGQRVRFEVDVLAVRPATDDQIERAHREAEQRIAHARGIVYEGLGGAPPEAPLIQLGRKPAEPNE